MYRKYLRVSEMLILRSMIHLRSEIPIESRPPVARSQLLHRENVSGDFPEPFQNTVIQSNVVKDASTNDIQVRVSTTHQTHESNQSLHSSRVPCKEQSPPNVQYIQSQNPESQNVLAQCSHPRDPSQQVNVAPTTRKTSYYGYNPSTPANPLPLSSLSSKAHGDTIGYSPPSLSANRETASH